MIRVFDVRVWRDRRGRVRARFLFPDGTSWESEAPVPTWLLWSVRGGLRMLGAFTRGHAETWDAVIGPVLDDPRPGEDEAV